MRIRRNITGNRFGHLTAIEPTDGRDGSGSIKWRCKCDCGNYKIVSSKLLLSGGVKSCCASTRKIDAQRDIKKCSKCREVFPISEFSIDTGAKDGHWHYCRSCTSLMNKESGKKNRPKIREAAKKKYWSDENFRIIHGMRNRVRLALQNNSKSGGTLDLLGCSIPELKVYLQERFSGGMSWENYGSYWEIDHIKPCSIFDLSKESEQRQCFHFSNLQPLEASINRSKGNKYAE